MTFKSFIRRFCLCLFVSFAFCFIGFILFKPIYYSNSVIIPYSLHSYDICIKNPELWNTIKFYFIIFYIASSFICSNCLYSLFFSKKHNVKSKASVIHKNAYSNIKQSTNNKDLLLFVGKNESNNLVFIPEKSLYQNILITGTIGSGKTSSCMYPFTRQLMACNKNNSREKLGMLILDVKGNYYKEVLNFATATNRLDDLYVIELRW